LKDSAVFDKKLLDKLVDELDDSARTRYPAGRSSCRKARRACSCTCAAGRGGDRDPEQHGGQDRPGRSVRRDGADHPRGTGGERRAKTDCVLLAINRNVFLDLVSTNPKFAIALLSAVGNRARFVALLRA